MSPVGGTGAFLIMDDTPPKKFTVWRQSVGGSRYGPGMTMTMSGAGSLGRDAIVTLDKAEIRQRARAFARQAEAMVSSRSTAPLHHLATAPRIYVRLPSGPVTEDLPNRGAPWRLAERWPHTWQPADAVLQTLRRRHPKKAACPTARKWNQPMTSSCLVL